MKKKKMALNARKWTEQAIAVAFPFQEIIWQPPKMWVLPSANIELWATLCGLSVTNTSGLSQVEHPTSCGDLLPETIAEPT